MAKEKTYSELTTPFFIEDNFFSEMEDYTSYAEIDEENVNELPDDYSVDVGLSIEEKVFISDDGLIDDLMERLFDRFEDRIPPEDERIHKQITDAFKQSIDFDKLQSLLPSLWYPNGKIAKITKQDLINAVS